MRKALSIKIASYSPQTVSFDFSKDLKKEQQQEISSSHWVQEPW